MGSLLTNTALQLVFLLAAITFQLNHRHLLVTTCGYIVLQADTMTENWCGVLQEVCIPGTSGNASELLEKAVRFANDACWGNLSTSIFIDPVTASKHKSALDAAIAGLKYGCITVNCPNISGYGTTCLGWGAFQQPWPGNDIKVRFRKGFAAMLAPERMRVL